MCRPQLHNNNYNIKRYNIKVPASLALLNQERRIVYPVETKYLNNIVQRRPNVFDVGPTLYKC